MFTESVRLMFTKEEYFWELSLYGTAEMLIFEYGTAWGRTGIEAWYCTRILEILIGQILVNGTVTVYFSMMVLVQKRY